VRGEDLSCARLAPLARSMPCLQQPPEEWDSWIRVPSFVLRGVGRQARYEYEIRIHTVEENWTLMRRYRRFRELHLSLSSKYGPQVCFFCWNCKMLATLRSQNW